MKRDNSPHQERVGWRNDEQRAEQPAPHRGRKDRKKWCKGRVGVAHGPFVVAYSSWAIGRQCHTLRWSNHEWLCFHTERCAACNRIMRHTLAENCPDAPHREQKESTT